MKTAVILPPTPSSFRKVAGVPLIKRTALSALRSGFHVVVLGHGCVGQLRALFDADVRTRAVEVVSEAGALGTEVTVVPSDCLLTAATLQRVGTGTLDGRPLLFAAADDTQIAFCRAAMLNGLDLDSLTAGGAERLWAALGARGAVRIALDGEVCTRITDEGSIARAEALLCEQLRTDSAASDGPLAHYVDRRLSLRISRWLVRHTSLRPNHITVIGTCVGLLAATLFGVGMYWSGVAGGLLFLCTTIIDGCDGEVARLTFQESPFGQKFDVITDNVVHVAIFIGLGIGLYRQSPQGHYLLLIGILLGGFACTSVVTYFFLVRRPGFARSGGTPVSWRGKVRQRLLRGFEALMNRDFAYLLLVLAVVDRLYWFMWCAAFGTYVFAILLIWIYRWREAA
ncbi:MAG TPA: CDP-alcohol phosphatidyltransferase family protein [Candidatus Margulisiibacteriota bacterium]|nr:CDP-alcohol phosphatidyltransferase family protein [Candidatus Margulisiibacteriota bacterium]